MPTPKKTTYKRPYRQEHGLTLPIVERTVWILAPAIAAGGLHGTLNSFAFQVGKAPLVPRDQTARSTGDKDVQKAQEPASKAYRDMAADAAEFQARSPAQGDLFQPIPCCISAMLECCRPLALSLQADRA